MTRASSLAAFFSDTPFQPPFGGGELAEGMLSSDYRRVRPLAFPEGDAARGEGSVPLSAAVSSSPFRQILLDPAVAPLLRLHPFQSAQGREGEREWLFSVREWLRERLSYGSLGSPTASYDGVLDQAEALLRAWTREKYLIEAEGIVLVATEAEIAARTVPPDAVPLRNPLAFSPARLYLLTPAAIEAELLAGGARAVGEIVESAHHVGSLAGVGPVDIRSIGAGLNPARLGFDLAFFDFSFFLEGDGEWYLPAFDRSFSAWLRPDADEEWTNRPDLLLRIDAGLRLMGEAGLAAAATAAAIRADYARRLLAQAGSKASGAGSLLEIGMPGRGPLRFSGLETSGEIESMVKEIIDEEGQRS
ncbi:hypothetical protein SAMN05444156_2697 [Verrucomicrobium sp. GAS474]|uniref:hypothetical protein n=1 Tax=Verrucomicrobium sp. GAS474 TaxID=1882831 RepID=UPI00087964C1|nr:hypothetical protein [Verrucomicrobium sp. GAS474]SDU22276.1 hypothetical protein SAMN05444156_2697 [Verrucomicrobium sp. GAS474]